jgi:hypothetical protein
LLTSIIRQTLVSMNWPVLSDWCGCFVEQLDRPAELSRRERCNNCYAPLEYCFLWHFYPSGLAYLWLWGGKPRTCNSDILDIPPCMVVVSNVCFSYFSLFPNSIFGGDIIIASPKITWTFFVKLEWDCATPTSHLTFCVKLDCDWCYR